MAKRDVTKPLIAKVEVMSNADASFWWMRGIGRNGRKVVTGETRARKSDTVADAKRLANQLGVPCIVDGAKV